MKKTRLVLWWAAILMMINWSLMTAWAWGFFQPANEQALMGSVVMSALFCAVATLVHVALNAPTKSEQANTKRDGT